MRKQFFSVACLSGAMIAQEILLMRLFSIIQWHHFAYMVISLALLGFGASGTLIAAARAPLLRHFSAAYRLSAVAFGGTVVGSFLLGQRLPFNPPELLWDPRPHAYLLALYVLLAVPFLCGATCIGLTFAQYPDLISRVYRYDLVGAGFGALLVVLGLFVFQPLTCLVLIGAVGFLAAALGPIPPPCEGGCEAGGGIARPRLLEEQEQKPLRSRLSPSWAWSLGTALLGLALVGSCLAFRPALRLSEYKGLSKALLLPDAKVVAERSGPLGRLSVVRSSAFHETPPGRSLNYFGPPPPPQCLLFVDGDSASVITRTPADVRDLEYLDYLSASLPYHLLRSPARRGAGGSEVVGRWGGGHDLTTSPPHHDTNPPLTTHHSPLTPNLPHVLVLGAGGGSDVLLALYYGARPVDAVELNPQIVRLMREEFGDFTRHLYDRPDVRVHVAEARGFVARSRERYDLIHVALLDSFSAAAAGTHALNECYLYTVEAFQEYRRHLRPGGMLSLTRWLKQPPRDELKLFATAVVALERDGVADPASHLAFIRSFNTTTLVVTQDPLTPAQMDTVRTFCDDRSFDLIHLPGLRQDETNRYNLLDDPTLYRGAQAILSGQRADFLCRYKFNLIPPTDNRPYFFHFLTWRVLPELLASRGQGGIPFAEWGYLILLATILQAALASLVLILAPLFTLRREPTPRGAFLRVLVYFLCLGLAFLFIEIAFIQKFILFLSHPLYAVAVVLCAFLVFAGLGSGASARLDAALRRAEVTGSIGTAIATLVALALLYLWLLPPLFRYLMPLPSGVKVVLSILLIAPLAFFMGMPFPLGLRRVADAAPSLIPWAWGINGCASVLSALLATLLALQWGFVCVILLAAALYAVAGITLRRGVY